MEDNRIKLFLSNFSKNSPTSEDLPQTRVANYSLNSEDIPGQVIDWVISYLENRKCPYSLALAIAKEAAHQVSASFAEIACNATEEELDKYSNASNMYAGTIKKIPDICNSFLGKGDFDISCASRHATSVFAIKNKRRKMEDRHVVIPDLNSLMDLKDLPQQSFYAVFDGHSGSDAACYAAAQLHVNIAKHPDFMTNIPKAIAEAYQITDLNFLNKCNKGNIKSGCTAVCALIRENQIYLSWCGDSLAVLVKDCVPSMLTNPHKPDREDERLRIENLGGHVTHHGTWRVGGLLAVSRSIGDPDQKRYISSEPEITTINLEGKEDFLILACDGLWDEMSPEDVTAVLYRYFLDNSPDEPLDAVAAKLVHQSKLQGSEDNITAIVIFLKDPKDIRESAVKFLNNSNLPLVEKDFSSLNGSTKSPDTDIHLSKPTILELNSTSTNKLKHTANVMSSAGFGSSSFSYQCVENIGDSSLIGTDYNLNTFVSPQKVATSYVAPEATALSELPTPPIDDMLASQKDDNFYATDLYKEINSAPSLNSPDLFPSIDNIKLFNIDHLPSDSVNISNIDMSLSDTQPSPNSSDSSKISTEEAVEIASSVVTTTVETAVKCLTAETSNISAVSQLNPYAKPFVMKSFVCPEENMDEIVQLPVVPDSGGAVLYSDSLVSSNEIEPVTVSVNTTISSVSESCLPGKNTSEQITNKLPEQIEHGVFKAKDNENRESNKFESITNSELPQKSESVSSKDIEPVISVNTTSVFEDCEPQTNTLEQNIQFPEQIECDAFNTKDTENSYSDKHKSIANSESPQKYEFVSSTDIEPVIISVNTTTSALESCVPGKDTSEQITNQFLEQIEHDEFSMKQAENNCKNINQTENSTSSHNKQISNVLPEELTLLSTISTDNFGLENTKECQETDSVDQVELKQLEFKESSRVKIESTLTEELSNYMSESQSGHISCSSPAVLQSPEFNIHTDDISGPTSVDCLNRALFKEDTEKSDTESDKISNDPILEHVDTEVKIEKCQKIDKLPTCASEIYSQEIIADSSAVVHESLQFKMNMTANVQSESFTYPVEHQDLNKNLLEKIDNEVTCKKSDEICTETENKKSDDCADKDNSNSSENTTKEFTLATTDNEVISISTEMPSDPSVEDSQIEAVAVDLQSLPPNIPEAEGVTEDADSDSEKDGGWSYVKGNTVSSSKVKSPEKKSKAGKSSLQKNIAAAYLKKETLKANLDPKSKVKNSPIDRSKLTSEKTRNTLPIDKTKTSTAEKAKSPASSDTIKKITSDKKTDPKIKVSKSSTLITTKTSERTSKTAVKTEVREVFTKTTSQKARPTTLLTNKTTDRVPTTIQSKLKVSSAATVKSNVKPVALNSIGTGSTSTESKVATTSTTIRNASRASATVPNRTLKTTSTSTRNVSSRPLATTLSTKTAQIATENKTRTETCPPNSLSNKRDAVATSNIRHLSQRPTSTLPSKPVKPRPVSEPRPRGPPNRPISTLRKPDVRDMKNDKQLSTNKNAISSKTESGSTLTSKRVVSENKTVSNKASNCASKSDLIKRRMPNATDSKSIKNTGSASSNKRSQNKMEDAKNTLNMAKDQKSTTEIIETAEEKNVLPDSNKEIASNVDSIPDQVIVQSTDIKLIHETSCKEIISLEEKVLNQQAVDQISQGLEAIILETNTETAVTETKEESIPVTENGNVPSFENNL